MYVDSIEAEVKRIADESTDALIKLILQSHEKQFCSAHNSTLKAYINAAIARTRARRDYNKGYWVDVDRVEKQWRDVREQFHREVYSCGCSNKYNHQFE